LDYNPYAPPIAAPPPAPPTGDDGFLAGGRPVEASRGYAWLTQGWELVRPRLGTWIVIGVLYAAALIGVMVIPVVGPFSVGMLTPLLSAGVYIACRDLREGRPFGIGLLFDGFKHARGLVVVGLFHVGQALVNHGLERAMGGTFRAFDTRSQLGLGAGGPLDLARLERLCVHGGVLFVVAIPVGMATYYAPALVALQGMPAIAALKNSFLGAWRNILPFVVYCICLTMFTVAAIVPCGLGVFVLVPVMMVSTYVGYRDIFFVGAR